MGNIKTIQYLMMQRCELASYIKKLKKKHGNLIDNCELHDTILNGSYKFLEENFDEINKHSEKDVVLPFIKQSICDL